MAEKKVSSIEIQVELDENKVPENISWFASDSPMEKFEDCKAFMLALWDKEQKNTLKMDLWIKEMPLSEMNTFYFQTLLTMADSYKRATNDEETAKLFADFAQQFGDKAGMREKS